MCWSYDSDQRLFNNDFQMIAVSETCMAKNGPVSAAKIPNYATYKLEFILFKCTLLWSQFRVIMIDIEMFMLIKIINFDLNPSRSLMFAFSSFFMVYERSSKRWL